MDSGGELDGNDLAIRLGKSKPTITKMMDRLIGEGLVSVSQDGGDLRRKIYALSQEAERLVAEVSPGYAKRVERISKALATEDKRRLLEILSRLDHSNPEKLILGDSRPEITRKNDEIRLLCRRSAPEDIDAVMAHLDGGTSLVMTKIIDRHLGSVTAPEAVNRIERYLFEGSQIQRNYACLFFARRNDWDIVKRAYAAGAVDYEQAFSK